MILVISILFLLLSIPTLVITITFVFQKYMYGIYIIPATQGPSIINRTKDSKEIACLIMMSIIPGFGWLILSIFCITFIYSLLRNPFTSFIKIVQKMYDFLVKAFEI